MQIIQNHETVTHYFVIATFHYNAQLKQLLVSDYCTKLEVHLPHLMTTVKHHTESAEALLSLPLVPCPR